MLGQLQGRLVRPLQVVDEDDKRCRPTAPRQELPDIREQESLLQRRRQVQRCRHVREKAVQLRNQLRQLGRARTNGLSKRRGWHQPRGLLEDFDVRDERWSVLLLVASADQRLSAELPRSREGFFRKSGFADTRVSEQ
jgi:hypothetical protein